MFSNLRCDYIQNYSKVYLEVKVKKKRDEIKRDHDDKKISAREGHTEK